MEKHDFDDINKRDEIKHFFIHYKSMPTQNNENIQHFMSYLLSSHAECFVCTCLGFEMSASEISDTMEVNWTGLICLL